MADSNQTYCWILIGFALLLTACQGEKKPTVVEEESFSTASLSQLGKEKLSDYGFFTGAMKNLEPVKGVIPYELNAPLFSDYAFKKRFMKIPEGQYAVYDPQDILSFPEGTVLIKNFYYPADFRQPMEKIQILETRLLILENGVWKALPYVWNEEQTEAYLDITGSNVNVHWTHFDGSQRQVLYAIPDMNQCSGCHLRGDKVKPIGPTARQLNVSMTGQHENQLHQLASFGRLRGVPDLREVPSLVSYEDESQPTDLRVRAWLEVNCAHCHRPDGPAKTSGLHLLADVTNPYELGIGKAPVAAGRGSGGLHYDIVPGSPESSILYYRINSDDPGVMMPELGKKLVHEEGVALVYQWIAEMK